jgi:outer membrane protein TolC
MSRRLPSLGTVLTLALVVVGCQPQQPFYFNQRGEMAFYRDMATEIEYPDVNVETLPDVSGALPPLTLGGNEPKQPWDLTLEEALRNALCNNKVMKQIGGQAAVVQTGGSGPATSESLLRAGLTPSAGTTSAPTVYDPAFNEASVEMALAAFDAQFSSSVNAQRIDNPVNESEDYTSLYAEVDRETIVAFQNTLSKTNATGGTASVSNSVRYTDSNSPLREFPSDWYVSVEAQITQPLMRGAGVTYNRIAGTGAAPLGGSMYNPQGVLIQRINTDISLANFENGVLNMVNDTETAYWELYFSYRSLEALQKGLDSALQTWRKIWALAEVGAKGGEAEKEAQAREQYFLFRSSLERSLNQLYHAEANLRYMMGIAASDGRIIRPTDEPTTAKVSFDWYAVHNEALAQNVNLRAQRWTVKQRELALIAAKNGLLPRLDAVARYRWLGLGDDLIGGHSDKALEAAVNEMFDGTYQEWALGLQFQMPLGFRAEMANVRNAQLRIARERALLQEAELELSHLLAHDLRDLEARYVLLETNFNRQVAAARQVEAVEAAYKADTITLDVLLNAQRLLAQDQSEYFRSLVDYNKSIALVHLRKNSLLQYNNVYLAEGPWPQKAYFDATRLARSRDAAMYLDYGMTAPRVLSRGPVEQNAGQALQGAAPVEEAAVQNGPEVVPTPAPAGAAPKLNNQTPTPVPVVPAPTKSAATTTPTAPLAKAAAWQSASPNGQIAAAKDSAPKASQRYDLGEMNLNALARSADTARPATSAVRPASYQTSTAAGTKTATAATDDAGWTGVAGSSATHESDSNLSSAQSANAASGWTRAQR